MIRIAFINNKGGVGKTTSAYNIASYFHLKKYKVLLVDLDAQANLTLYAKLYPNQLKKTIYDLMHKATSFGEEVTKEDIESVIQKSDSGMDIIPANIGAERINQDLLHVINREGILSSILSIVEDDYDVCVIDSPPNLGLAASNGIAASDFVFIPIKAGPWEILGMRMLAGVIRALRAVSKRDIKIGGTFFTQFVQMYRVSKDMEEALTENNFKLLETRISNSVKVIGAARENKSIFEYARKSDAPYKDYENLAKEIISITGIKKSTKRKAK